MASIDDIDALLPQWHCQACGYEGCRPYAEAIAKGAPINRCKPGGETIQAQLSALTHRESPPGNFTAPITEIASIDPEACIGCTKCLSVCPVDAIAGSLKQLHAIIESECTGCQLCLPTCPVDCIRLQPDPFSAQHRAPLSRERFQKRAQRLRYQRQQRRTTIADPIQEASPEEKRSLIAAAIARAKRSEKKR